VILGRQWREESDAIESIWEQKAQDTKAKYALKSPGYAHENAQEESSLDDSTLNTFSTGVEWSQVRDGQELRGPNLSFMEYVDLMQLDSPNPTFQRLPNASEIVVVFDLSPNGSLITSFEPTALNIAAQRDDDANIPMAMYERIAADYNQRIRDELALAETRPTTTYGNTELNSTLAREIDFQLRSRAEDERMTRIDPYNTPSHQNLSLTDRTRSPSTEVDHFNLDNFQQNSDPDWSSSNDFSTVDTSTADDNPFSIFNNPDMSYNLFDTWTPAADSP